MFFLQKKSVDERFEELGYRKVDTDEEFLVRYQRNRDGYTHHIDIIRKSDGNHVIMSYQFDILSEFTQNAVGLTSKEALLAVEKLLSLKWRRKV